MYGQRKAEKEEMVIKKIEDNFIFYKTMTVLTF